MKKTLGTMVGIMVVAIIIGTFITVKYATAGEKGRDGRFISYDNGTVRDTRTGRMWAARDNGSDINWANAKSYCKNYRGGGYTDWRMPTQDELAMLHNTTLTDSRGFHKTYLIELTGCCPWASEARGSDAAGFNFLDGDGNRFWNLQSYDLRFRALPVRAGK